MLLRHSKSGFAVVGFGQNEEMGSFLLQGTIEIFSQSRLKEKQMS
jgi:hypothetical protein